MEHKKGFDCIFGVILILVSLFMIFKNTYVTTISFYYFGRVNTGAILVVLLVLAVIFAVARPSAFSHVLIGVILAGLVISLLMGMHIGFRRMSVLDVILMVIPLAVGVGLVLKNLLTSQ